MVPQKKIREPLSMPDDLDAANVESGMGICSRNFERRRVIDLR